MILAVTRYADSPVGPFNLAMLRLGGRARRPSARFPAGRRRQRRRRGAGAQGSLGHPGRGRRGEVRPPPRPRDGHSQEGRQDHPRLRAGRSAARSPAATCSIINWVTAANAPLDGTIAADADPGRSEIHLPQGRARQAAGQRVLDPASVERTVRSSFPNAIVGTCCTVDTDLPRIRFVMDPLKPVFQGTRRRMQREARADEWRQPPPSSSRPERSGVEGPRPGLPGP